MELAKSYINKEIYGETYEEFCQKIDQGVDFEKLEIHEKLEWILMFLDYKNTFIRQGDDVKAIDFKQNDGSWLVDKINDADSMKFLDPNYNDGLDINLFDNFDAKVLSLGTNRLVSISRYKKLSLPEKRGICMPNENAVNFSMSYIRGEKWFSQNQNYKVVDIFKIPAYYERAKEQIEKLSLKIGEDVKIGDKTYSWNYFVFKNPILSNYLYPIPNKAGIVYNKITKDFFDSSYNEMVTQFKMMASFALTMHYEWSIYIKEKEDSLGFRVPINPVDLSELKRFNFKKDGSKKAIIHFVREHTRKSNCEQIDKETIIKKYLRGETRVDYNGTIAHIIPSKSDIINTGSKKKFLEL